MIISQSWDSLLDGEYHKPYFLKLVQFLEREYDTHCILPPKGDLFNAFRLTDYENVRAVIIGQDPYHEKGQAHGVCFSVRPGVKIPPSLENILTELSSDLSVPRPRWGDLTKWGKQGVLLLNTVLTVREGIANSHRGYGWEQFTDTVLKLLNEKKTPIVFILWGSYAIKKGELITNPKHLLINAPHPSPLSAYRGFFGGKYFSRCNQFLKTHDQLPIDWDLTK
jgi:uracil-DNA glycosylase